MTVEVTGRALSPAGVASVARRGAPVRLAPTAESRIREGERRLRSLVEAGSPIYGLTTGVGALDARSLGLATNRDQQRALLRSHAAGVGEPMGSDEVRAMLLARLNALAGGVSGVRLPIARALVALLNSPVVPFVPRRGSVGASDMAPLAHAALALAGEGRAFVDGVLHKGSVALERAGLTPIEPEMRDAFALINGPAQSAGLGALAIVDVWRLVRTSEVATAMTMAALGSRRDFLDARLEALRNHPGGGTERVVSAVDARRRGGRTSNLAPPRATLHARGSAGARRASRRHRVGRKGRVGRAERVRRQPGRARGRVDHELLGVAPRAAPGAGPR